MELYGRTVNICGYGEPEVSLPDLYVFPSFLSLMQSTGVEETTNEASSIDLPSMFKANMSLDIQFLGFRFLISRTEILLRVSGH